MNIQENYFERLKTLANLLFPNANLGVYAEDEETEYTTEMDFEDFLRGKEKSVKEDANIRLITSLKKDLNTAKENLNFYKDKCKVFENREKTINAELRTKGIKLGDILTKKVDKKEQGLVVNRKVDDTPTNKTDGSELTAEAHLKSVGLMQSEKKVSGVNDKDVNKWTVEDSIKAYRANKQK